MNEQKLGHSCHKLAVIVQPYEDELFSSWIFRLALANAVEPYYLHKFITNNKRSWAMDLDVTRNEAILHSYSLATGYHKKEIRRLLLHDLLERLAVKRAPKTNSRWLIPLNNRKRNLVAPGGVLFCPICLIKYGYFKQHWRLATTTICLEHMIYLKEYCQRCKTPVILKYAYIDTKRNLNDETMMYCVNCGFDLRKSFKHHAKLRSIKHNQFNIKAVRDGYITIEGLQIQYSHLYFEVVSVLSCVLLFRKNGAELYNFISKQLGINYPRWSLVNQNMRTIENIPLNSRDTILYVIDWFLSDWPKNFWIAVSFDTFNYSLLQTSRDYKPFWFNAILSLIKKNN